MNLRDFQFGLFGWRVWVVLVVLLGSSHTVSFAQSRQFAEIDAEIRQLLDGGNQDDARQLVRSLVDESLREGSGFRVFRPSGVYARLYDLAEQSVETGVQERLCKAGITWINELTPEEALVRSIDLLALAKAAQTHGKPADWPVLRTMASARLDRAQRNEAPLSLPTLEALHLLSAVTQDDTLRDDVAALRNPLWALDGERAVELAPFELHWLAARWREEDDQENLSQLGQFITERYLPQPGVADALSISGWRILIDLIRDTADSKGRESFGTWLHEHLQSRSRWVERLEPEAVAHVVRALQEMNISSQVTETIVARLLRLTEIWPHLDAQLRQSTVQTIGDPSSDCFADFEKPLLQRYEQGDLSLAQCELALVVSRTLGYQESFQDWSERLWTQFVDGPSGALARSESINVVAPALGVLARNRVQLGESMASWLAKAVVDWSDAAPGAPGDAFADAGSLLRSVVPWDQMWPSRYDTDQRVRLGIVRVLGSLASETAQSSQLIKELESRLADRQGDSLARQHLALGYAIAAAREPRSRGGGFAVQVRQGFAAAESSTVRLLCLEALASVAVEYTMVDQALQVLTSVRGQFEPSEQASIDQWRALIERDQANRARGSRAPAEFVRHYRRIYQLKTRG